MSPANLDDRLRAALHDLDARAAEHTGRTAQPATRSPRRALRFLVPLAAGVAVVALLFTVAGALRPDVRPAVPAAPTPAPTAAPDVPSQTAAEARRDGIYPQIAALNVVDRTARGEDDPEPVTAEGDVWQIATRELSELETDENGCLRRPAGAPEYPVCSYSSSELQLLSADGRRILRAYPFPDVQPTWFTVTRDAVYCGRTGDGAVPEGMLCRVDRRTGELTGRIYACDVPDCSVWDERELAAWPGTWSQGTEPVSGYVEGVRERADGDLDVLGQGGGVTVTVDAKTLRER